MHICIMRLQKHGVTSAKSLGDMQIPHEQKGWDRDGGWVHQQGEEWHGHVWA